MAEEKQFTIPLRREFIKAPSYKKSERAIKAIRNFIEKHMKSDNVKIGKYLNLKIFERGRKNPPPRVKVKVLKEEKLVRVELVEYPFDVQKKDHKEKKKEEKIEETKEAPKLEEKAEVKTEEEKEVKSSESKSKK